MTTTRKPDSLFVCTVSTWADLGILVVEHIAVGTAGDTAAAAVLVLDIPEPIAAEDTQPAEHRTDSQGPLQEQEGDEQRMGPTHSSNRIVRLAMSWQRTDSVCHFCSHTIARAEAAAPRKETGPARCRWSRRRQRPAAELQVPGLRRDCILH
jgi:hypothetical protein